MNGHDDHHGGRPSSDDYASHQQAAVEAGDDSMSRGHEHATHGTTADDGHGHHGTHGHGDHAAMFRDRFWWSLVLTIPVVATSHMVMDWFGYELDFYGIDWVGPVLGSVLFWWAGSPFLSGGWHEARARRPGMMLLISLAIVWPTWRRWRRASTGSTWSSGGSWRH